MCDCDHAIDLAEALAAKLTEFSFSAVMCYLPFVDAEELTTPRIFVAPSGHAQSPADRGTNYHDIELRIFVTQMIKDVNDVTQVSVPARTMAGIKRLYDNPNNATAEHPHVGALRHATIAGAKWLGSLVNNPLFDPEQLANSNLYIAQTVVTYRGRN